MSVCKITCPYCHTTDVHQEETRLHRWTFCPTCGTYGVRLNPFDDSAYIGILEPLPPPQGREESL
jgi:hypothetical protein